MPPSAASSWAAPAWLTGFTPPSELSPQHLTPVLLPTSCACCCCCWQVAEHCSDQGMQFLLAVRGCSQDNSVYTPVIPLNVQCTQPNQLGAGLNNGIMGAGAGAAGAGGMGGLSGLSGLTDAPAGQQGQRRRSSASSAAGGFMAATAAVLAAVALL